ncbi:MAG: hybrid sensor histidine kinase/response regulator [Candidatus Magnetomorum sp.]|nr:hybrid sensor histidine kinase/response regulator [Candidatus Magnetomorum sp.]
MKEDELLKRLRAAFKMEASERLTSISSSLLALEKSYDHGESNTETLDVVFREAHSLKGAARAVNYSDIETLCQAFEEVFSALKRKDIVFSSEMFDVLLSGLELIETLLNDPESNHASEINSIYKTLEHIRLGLDEPVKKKISDSKSQPESDTLFSSIQSVHSNSEKKSHHSNPSRSEPVVMDKDKSDFVKNTSKADMHNTSQLPIAAPPETNITETRKGENISLPDMPTDSITEEVLRNDNAFPVKKIPASQPEPQPNNCEQKVPSKKTEKSMIEETVRISTQKLDSLLLKVEELVSLKLASGQHLRSLKATMLSFETWKKRWLTEESTFRWIRRKTRGSKTEPRNQEHLKKLESFLDWNQKHIISLEQQIKKMIDISAKDQRSLSIMIDDVLDDMKKVTMQPFSSLSQIFPKMVRDLCREQSKTVDFNITGNEVEIDRRILEELKDPLTHLLRNSIDHGIETSEVRNQLKKSKRATLTLSISHVLGNKVDIIIEDDGKGIDLERVRREAVKRGMITEKDAANLTEKENLALIFRQELSTSPIITQISGRGLGLAIVQERIQKLGGMVTVESFIGQGTTFQIQVPITLATSRGILIQLHNKLFVVPVTYVERVMRVETKSVKTVENKATITLEGEVISFVSLSDLLEIPVMEAHEKKEFITVIVLEVSGKLIACRVDEVLGEQEVLVKSLGKQLSRVRNIAGATILGSGKVVPMLNVHDLIQSSGKSSLIRSFVTDEKKADTTQGKSILVAEDSITSRMLIQNILESAEYIVSTAVDGLDAYTSFKTGHFDLVVSDVEMPKMNGFELTEKIRDDKQRGETPVVLVTSLQSPEDRKRGIDAGANAYIVKSNFDQSNLLEVIERLI